MKRILAGAAVLLLTAGVCATSQAATVTYNWSLDENGEVAGPETLGTYGNISTFLNSDSGAAYSEEYSLGLTDLGGTTPQAYVGWVTNLQDGDEITASFWVWDNTPNASPSGRIWGHYTSDINNINSYVASAGGNDTYSGATEWTLLEQTWIFDSAGGTRNGLVIEARPYGPTNGIGTIFIDDLTITASDLATIITPGGTTSPVPVPGAIWLLTSGLAGLAGFRRKKH